MTERLGSILVLSTVALMAARAAPPIAVKVSGSTVLDLPVGLFFRLLAQKLNVVAILAVLILGSGAFGERWIPHGMFLFAIFAVVGLLLVPSSYHFTTAGVSPNRATFRSWSDFAGWVHSGNVVYLQGVGGQGSLKLYVAGKDQDALFKVLGRYLPADPGELTRSRPLARAGRRKLRQKGGVL